MFNTVKEGIVSENKTVQCVTCGQNEPVITSRIPFSPAVRDDIASRVGSGCWQRWMDQQLKIINEYRLNLGDPSSHELLRQACYAFLKLDEDGAAVQPETGPDKARELGNLSN